MQRIDAPAVQLLVRAAQRDVSWIMAGSARLRRATLSILRNSIEQGCLDLDPTSEFLPLLLTRATYAIARQAHNSTSGERASSLDAFVRRIFVPTINDHLHTNYSGVSLPNASFHPELTGRQLTGDTSRRCAVPPKKAKIKGASKSGKSRLRSA